MKDYSARKGWLFKLIDGPNAGQWIRLGWRLPNGERIPVDEQLTFPSGAVYRRHQACWKSNGKDHRANDLRFDKDGNPYWEFRWVEGTGQ